MKTFFKVICLFAILCTSNAYATSYPKELIGFWSSSNCAASYEAYKSTDTWMGFTINDRDGFWNEQTNCSPVKVGKDKNNNFQIDEKCESEGEPSTRNFTYALTGNNLVLIDNTNKKNPTSKYIKCEAPTKKNNKK